VTGAMIRFVLIAILVAATGGIGLSGQSPAPGRPQDRASIEVKMEKTGQSHLFDYGEMVIRVRYLSDSRLAWEQIKGPQAGLKAEEDYGFAAIRPGVCFFWWQEKDSSVVSQVVDFEKGRVNTTWTSPEKKVSSFQGTVRAAPQ
jgi:hypothetical protein